MSIRKKTLAIIGITFLLLIGVLVVASQIVVLGGFAHLENEAAHVNGQRAINEIGDTLSTLNATVGDWAPWDDTYIFVEDRNEAYVESNLTVSTLANLQVNFMIFIKTVSCICSFKVHFPNRNSSITIFF